MSKTAHEDLVELKTIWMNGADNPVLRFFSAHKRQPKSAARRAYRLWRRVGNLAEM